MREGKCWQIRVMMPAMLPTKDVGALYYAMVAFTPIVCMPPELFEACCVVSE